MNYQSTLTNLYFLLIHSDGKVNDHEIQLGHKLMKLEGMGENQFYGQIELLRTTDFQTSYNIAVKAVKKLERNLQIRCMAWLCVAANADGFMDKSEWQFIYKIYNKELNLPLEEILKKQKELTKEFKANLEPAAVTVL